MRRLQKGNEHVQEPLQGIAVRDHNHCRFGACRLPLTRRMRQSAPAAGRRQSAGLVAERRRLADPNPGTPAAGPAPNANPGSANEEIVVTGSLLRRTNTETPSPVTVLSAETLAQRGINTVGEAVQQPFGEQRRHHSAGLEHRLQLRQRRQGVRRCAALPCRTRWSMFDGLRMAFYPLPTTVAATSST